MLLLVDFSSMLYRAYHATPDSFPLNGVRGFLQSLARIVEERRPGGLALCTDEDWRPQFRTEALPMYKQQRVALLETDPVPAQETVARELLVAMGIPMVGWPSYEAEDVIATLAARSSEECEILSGDRDLFALVEDPRVRILYPAKGGMQVVTESWVTQKYGIPGRAYGDFALLRGDPSDGLPGVAGIGEKTASALISRYGSLEGVLAAPDLPAKTRARLDAAHSYLEAARRVVLPVADLPIPERSLALSAQEPDPETVERIVREGSLESAVERWRKVVRQPGLR